MRDYIVISDSTADLPIAVVKELEVPIVPFSYSIEEQVYEYYLDERDGDIGSFYERLRKGAMPVTSQINPAMYQDFFEQSLQYSILPWGFRVLLSRKSFGLFLRSKYNCIL